MNLTALDSSPLVPQPTELEAAWLRSLAKSLRPSSFIVTIGRSRDDDEPLVYCERDGTWWAGRYVGCVVFDGGRLSIGPRFGLSTLAGWLGTVMNVVLSETPGRLREDVPFIVKLLAIVWAKGFVEAARHGLPALYREERHTGPRIRGRLDVRGTVGEIAAGRGSAVSIRRERSLENPVSRAIAAAYSVLRRWMPPGSEERWLPEQAGQLIPRLLAATGSRPPVPSDEELARVRYTPITEIYKPFVRLSRQIVEHRGLWSDASARGETQGILLDVAELWELFVLEASRRAYTGLTMAHGTRDRGGEIALIRSEAGGGGLGNLRPDVLVRDRDKVVGILDAKYKSLWPSLSAPYGPQREDLYQLAAYLLGFDLGRPKWGILAYPEDPARTGPPPAERRNPWGLGGGHRAWFVTLPHDLGPAIDRLRTVPTSNVSVGQRT